MAVTRRGKRGSRAPAVIPSRIGSRAPGSSDGVCLMAVTRRGSSGAKLQPSHPQGSGARLRDPDIGCTCTRWWESEMKRGEDIPPVALGMIGLVVAPEVPISGLEGGRQSCRRSSRRVREEVRAPVLTRCSLNWGHFLEPKFNLDFDRF